MNIDELKRLCETSIEKTREIENQIKSAEREEKAARQAELRPLAQRAHDLLCPYNHTDGCGWDYEGKNWDGSEHVRWLDKIEAILSASGNHIFAHPKVAREHLTQILELMDEAKQIDPRAVNIIVHMRQSR